MIALTPALRHNPCLAMKGLVNFIVQVTYNVLFMTFFLITGSFFLWRLWRRGKLLPQFGQRLGSYSRETRALFAQPVDLWMHAVSVGETMLAKVLLTKLREEQPALRVVITTTTATGFAVAKTLEDTQTFVLYNPIDFLWSVRSAFRLIRPRRLLLIESEIWPNYLWCARRRHIPVYLINARLSQRTELRYRKLRRWLAPLLAELSLVFAQDETDVERLTRAGFPSEIIFNLGSLKYDVAALDSHQPAEISWWNRLGWGHDHLVLLGGSTHPGEEDVLARIYRELKPKCPNLRLALAPRHAERGPTVRDLCQNLGLNALTRTELLELPAAPENLDALVVNSTGELRALYAHADIVFVGKSLRGSGGQNFLEAAPFGHPILVGPKMQNFAIATRAFLEAGAILQVSDEFELQQRLKELLASHEMRQLYGDRARQTFQHKLELKSAALTAQIILQSLAAERKNERI